MGRVFSPAEVTIGLVPNADSFVRARRTFNRMGRTAIGNGLITTIVYGSVAANTTNERSDFDCMLVHDGTLSGRRTCQNVISETKKAAGGLVPVSASPYPRALLESGRHEIDRFFAQHLIGGQQISRGEDLADYLTCRADPAPTILANYLARKKRQLETAYVSDEEADRLRGIQVMLEAPIAVGRKTLQVVGEFRGQNLCPTDSADKGSVAGEALALFSEIGATDFALSALHADERYSFILSNTLAGRTTQSRYRDNLDALDDMVPQAAAWVDAVDEGVRSLIGSLN